MCDTPIKVKILRPILMATINLRPRSRMNVIQTYSIFNFFGSFQGVITPERISQTVSVGDNVTLRVQTATVDSLRWRHDGDFISDWNDNPDVLLANVGINNGGIYECHRNHERYKGLHAIFQLIVRGNTHYYFVNPCI